jgi:hypothetical protein
MDPKTVGLRTWLFADWNPRWFLPHFPEPGLRRNHYGGQVIPDPYQGLSVHCLFLGEHRGRRKK